MPDLSVALVCGLAVLVGSAVQGGVGLGLGLVAAPVVSLVEPALMPGSVLVATAALATLTVAREIAHVDWRGLAWALPARVAGTVLGAWLVATAPQRALGVGVGLMVLAAIGITGRVAVPRTPLSLMVAGSIAGVTGTATSIGGPPVALIYQRESGPLVRSTLAVFFCLGTLLSLASLAVAGHLPAEAVVMGLLMLPFLVVGFALSGPARPVLDSGRTRAALLTVCAASAVALIVRSLL